MARTIAQTVGRGARNLNSDVKTVQQLLNGVFPRNGGPTPLLKDDGLCGPKTKDAISRFQLRHFGWSGADGRVDPGRRTIDKLNELNEGPTTGTFFILHQSKTSGVLRRSNRQDWFMKIEVVPIPFRPGRFQFGIFWFGPVGTAPRVVPSESLFLHSQSSQFKTTQPCTLDQLVGPAVCRDQEITFTRNRTQAGATLERTFLPRFNAFFHVGMDPDEPPGPGVIVNPLPGITVVEYRAHLARVK